MEKNLPFEELVKLVETEGSIHDLSDVLLKLYAENSEHALNMVIRLALFNYGGYTYKDIFQNTAMLGTLHWGVSGLKKLGEMAIMNDGFRAINNITNLLSHISSRSLTKFSYFNQGYECVLALNLTDGSYESESWITAAKELLVEVVSLTDPKSLFPSSIRNNLSFASNDKAQQHLFASLIARWFNFDIYGLNQYEDLIKSGNKAEIEFQKFLSNNPYILEPFHAQIWAKPRFGEGLVPDFLIRSMDNDYTVIEIERPDLPIFTKSGELSSIATHAKRQVLDFRDWAINNHLYAVQRFEKIYRPQGLVVIGLERELDVMQSKRLRQENESTQGVLRIVGFDWLYDRAKAIFDNLIKYGFEKGSFKNVIVDKY